jgi:hypothetical protein
VVLPEHGQEIPGKREVRKQQAARARCVKTQECRGSHAEAEAFPIHKSIEPAEERSSTGSVWDPADRVAEAEAVAGRVE